jgi:hypothetical protein
MLNVYLKQRSKYRFVDGVSVLLQSQHKLFGQSEQGIGAFPCFLVDRPFNPGFFQAFARLPGLQRFRAF